MHKDSKLVIMTNEGKNRLVKVVFTSILKISDTCANSFGRYIMTAQCMRNVLLNSSFIKFMFYSLFIKFKFLWKNDISEKIRAHLPQDHPPLQKLFSRRLFNFNQKDC